MDPRLGAPGVPACLGALSPCHPKVFHPSEICRAPCLPDCPSELKTCLVSRTSGLERGIKALTVNKDENPNGMHGALFKALGVFEIGGPIKSEWVQKRLESRELGSPWGRGGWQGWGGCEVPSPGLGTRKSEPSPFAVAFGGGVGGQELPSPNNPGQSGSVSRLMN